MLGSGVRELRELPWLAGVAMCCPEPSCASRVLQESGDEFEGRRGSRQSSGSVPITIAITIVLDKHTKVKDPKVLNSSSATTIRR